MTEASLLGRLLYLDLPLTWRTFLWPQQIPSYVERPDAERPGAARSRVEPAAWPYEIRLERCDPLPRPANAVARDATQYPRQTSVWATARGWWWEDDGRGAGVQAHFDEVRTEIWVWGLASLAAPPKVGAPTDASTAAFALVLSLAWHEALRASGLFPLHAAAAVAPGDVAATVFVGPSGRGKTTTLLRAMRAGWAPVCEDMAWLEPSTLTLYCWDHGPNLLPDTLYRVVPSLAARLPRLANTSTHAKVRFSYDRLANHFGVSWRPNAPLGRIVALERGRHGWHSLSRLEAVPLLWEATGLSLQPWMRQQTARQIAALSKRVTLARLELDADFDDLAAFR